MTELEVLVVEVVEESHVGSSFGSMLESNVHVLTGILAQVDGVFGESAFLAVSKFGFSLNGFEAFRIGVGSANEHREVVGCEVVELIVGSIRLTEEAETRIDGCLHQRTYNPVANRATRACHSRQDLIAASRIYVAPVSTLGSYVDYDESVRSIAVRIFDDRRAVGGVTVFVDNGETFRSDRTEFVVFEAVESHVGSEDSSVERERHFLTVGERNGESVGIRARLGSAAE